MKQRLELLGLHAVMALAAVNLWTGSPLLALWVGSQTVEGSRPTMTAILVVAVVMGLCSYGLIRVLQGASAAHDRLLGTAVAGRRQLPWMKPMTAERAESEREKGVRTWSVLDRILVGAVVLGVLAFEAWFFLFAGASI